MSAFNNFHIFKLSKMAPTLFHLDLKNFIRAFKLIHQSNTHSNLNIYF